jgi:biopolymer transport protein ExbD
LQLAKEHGLLRDQVRQKLQDFNQVAAPQRASQNAPLTAEEIHERAQKEAVAIDSVIQQVSKTHGAELPHWDSRLKSLASMKTRLNNLQSLESKQQDRKKTYLQADKKVAYHSLRHVFQVWKTGSDLQANLLDPLVEQIHKRVLEATKIHADDAVVISMTGRSRLITPEPRERYVLYLWNGRTSCSTDRMPAGNVLMRSIRYSARPSSTASVRNSISPHPGNRSPITQAIVSLLDGKDA